MRSETEAEGKTEMVDKIRGEIQWISLNIFFSLSFGTCVSDSMTKRYQEETLLSQRLISRSRFASHSSLRTPFGINTGHFKIH